MSSPYDSAVSSTLMHTNTKLADWAAVPVRGFSGDGMPEFDFPAGYSHAPVLYEGECCELCGHGIKRVYWIQCDSRRWTMRVGSECVTHFGEGESGEKLARDARERLEREQVQEAQDVLQSVIARFRCGSACGICRIPNDTIRRAAWKLARILGYDQAGYRSSKWLYLDTAAVDHERKLGRWSAAVASPRQIRAWLTKHGETLDELTAILTPGTAAVPVQSA